MALDRKFKVQCLNYAHDKILRAYNTATNPIIKQVYEEELNSIKDWIYQIEKENPEKPQK